MLEDGIGLGIFCEFEHIIGWRACDCVRRLKGIVRYKEPRDRQAGLFTAEVGQGRVDGQEMRNPITSRIWYESGGISLIPVVGVIVVIILLTLAGSTSVGHAN